MSRLNSRGQRLISNCPGQRSSGVFRLCHLSSWLVRGETRVMGLLFSRKKPKNSGELLDGLDNTIKKLSARRQRKIYQEKSFIGYLLILSFIVYLVGVLVFYLYYSPQSWLEYGLYSIPLVLFPLVVYMCKKMLNMYFAHTKAQLDQELSNLQAEKRKVLNEVMENETFNVARELLQRFDPQHPSLRETTDARGQRPRATAQTPLRREAGAGELRQRLLAHTPHPSQQHQQHTRTLAQTVPRPSRPTQPSALPPPQPHIPTLSQQAPAPTPPPSTGNAAAVAPPPQPPLPHHTTQFIPPGMCLGPAPGPPTPSPILPRDRSNVDKMVEFLVGDGPNNRYALICSSCHSHNGMALRDEFEYVSFRCAYCFHLNPARRSKPALRAPTPVSQPGAAPSTAGAGSVTMATDQRERNVNGVEGGSLNEGERNATTRTESGRQPTFTEQEEVEGQPPADHVPQTD